MNTNEDSWKFRAARLIFQHSDRGDMEFEVAVVAICEKTKQKVIVWWSLKSLIFTNYFQTFDSKAH